MKKVIFFIFGVISIFFIGCVSAPESEKMQLIPKAKSQEILNLRNLTTSGDVEYIQQDNKLMKSGFLNTSTEEYGYFYTSMHWDWQDYGKSGWVYLGAYTLGVWDLLGIIGMPTDSASFDIRSQLFIFNSNGDLIKSYAKNGEFTQRTSWWYGHNTTKTAAKYFTKQWDEIFGLANAQSGEINQALKNAGAITIEKDKEAQGKMQNYLGAFFSSQGASDRATSQRRKQAADNEAASVQSINSSIQGIGSGVQQGLQQAGNANQSR
ncbi:MAG: hypothetical protein LBT01_07385 [Spirochaetaceae bacterium]|jgi:hypothetical protein|nr:hypothetical protein [Spirochaetaceae bacterium]